VRWQFRCLRNTIVASIPGYGRLRQLKRRFVPYDSVLDDWTIEQGLQMIELLKRAGRSLHGATALELGSGWKPVIPLLLRLAGARQVFLIDSERLLDARLLSRTAEQLAAKSEQLSLRLKVPEQQIQALLLTPMDRDLETAACHFGLKYLAPCDARHLPIPAAAIDIVVSRAVLEHIPKVVLQEIFKEFERILAPTDGFMCHVIDNSDHWAHNDTRLSMVNFLRYSSSVWKRFAKNPLDYMNRMRHSEYLGLLSDSGFEVVIDDSKVDAAALADIGRLPIDESFRKFAIEDLAILMSKLVARRRRG
jgi:SAM-dependent methyltransferase